MVLVAITLYAPQVCATSYAYPRPDMEKCVRGAGRIFSGTLLRTRSYRTDETILTEYFFSDVVWVHGGDGSDSASVTMRGGSYGGRKIYVEGNPDLQVGERLVILAPSPEQAERTHHLLSIRQHCLCRVLDREKLRDVVTPTGWGRHFKTEKELLRELRSLLPSPP